MSNRPKVMVVMGTRPESHQDGTVLKALSPVNDSTIASVSQHSIATCLTRLRSLI